MTRAIVLSLAILACLGQAGDHFRMRASICQDRGCTKRTQVAFAPALVRLEVFVSRALNGRRMAYGLICDGFAVSESIVDVDADYAPLYIREVRDVGAGECVGQAHLILADGSSQRTQSTAVIIQPGLRD